MKSIYEGGICGGVKGTKTYGRTKSQIINTIYDIIELQKGELILSDTRLGNIHYELKMYDYVWELLYTITDTGTGNCSVSIRIIGERRDKAREIRREFALLDMMLSEGAEVEMSE